MVYQQEYLKDYELQQLAKSTLECEQMIKEKKCSKADCKTCTKREAMEAILRVADPYDLLKLDSMLKEKHANVPIKKDRDIALIGIISCLIGVPIIGGLISWFIIRICN